MNKQTKELNIFLIVIAVIGITAPWIVTRSNHQIDAVQIDVGEMEVTPVVYDTIYALAVTCDLTDTLHEMLVDDKISFNESLDIAEICKAQALDNAGQPFERGMLKQELNYIKNGGVSM